MSIISYAITALTALILGQTSFRLGSGNISVSTVQGNPQRLTAPDVLHAVALELAGAPASVTIGNTVITYTSDGTPTPAVSNV
jgi:hypothetical protein